ncbi:PEP-CTERM sorting domain-containing protein [Roseisolibacter sp. H3M3-2]|uniref:PEP-CTERM sorting domain-containing protein n=1 Tax=Roseisolibacter sp. H3M3-2 TaxID=3031323 RepID=UPI0023DA6094|nr:PEP-CTERM sorting domain-containing protein [Roseisolibacter sp. H3M3-2]MDF1501450.1 PEP-CTERM sorting domain-containing protein [Roseisolibacter sp. H3M3-2]
MPLARPLAAALLLQLALAAPAAAQSQYADAVIRYLPLYSGGPGPTLGTVLDPTTALGSPASAPFVTLGRGGLIELAFLDNVLTNSNSAAPDLWIYEIGADIEDTFVAIRPTATTALLLGATYDANGDGFYEIGKVFGSTSTIDIDQFFAGFLAGQLEFDAVQLIDDPAEGDQTGATVGADINAVEALTSRATSTVPEPTTVALLGGGLLAMAAGARRRRR